MESYRWSKCRKINGEEILTMTQAGSVTSNFYRTSGEQYNITYDAYTETPCEKHDYNYGSAGRGDGGVSISTYYWDINYFKSAGQEILGDTFRVNENGIYTVYAEDELGNRSIKKIEITKINKERS